LSRRIQVVYIRETSDYETMKILLSIKEEFEERYGLKITDEAIKYCFLCCKKCVNDKYFIFLIKQ